MSRKISADITDENSEALNKDKEVSGRTYSKTINQLIQIFLRSPDIHDELIAICKSQIRKRSELIQTGAVINQEVQKLKNGNFVYLNMLRILTGNMNLTLKNVLSEERMRSIRLANGYLICSNRILLVNESDANKWHFACQIEVIGAGFETPIFMFLSDKKASEYTNEDIDQINQLCVQKWSRFQQVLDEVKQYAYVNDPSSSFHIDGIRASAIPHIFYSNVLATNDEGYSVGEFDSKIVRTGTACIEEQDLWKK